MSEPIKNLYAEVFNIIGEGERLFAEKVKGEYVTAEELAEILAITRARFQKKYFNNNA